MFHVNRIICLQMVTWGYVTELSGCNITSLNYRNSQMDVCFYFIAHDTQAWRENSMQESDTVLDIRSIRVI